MTITYDDAKQMQADLEAAVKAAGDALKPFPKGPMGLTCDFVRATPEYRTAKATYDSAFTRLRAFNQRFTKMFAAQIRAERKVRVRS